ncbi:hypothetical protein B1F77_11560 [Pseudomonas syringae]|nr:hypothetical protein B1F77_11560 [Pseudomonas syringae]RXT81937.1 hypothetical protein B1F72_25665 [Pseudomonas syringae]
MSNLDVGKQKAYYRLKLSEDGRCGYKIRIMFEGSQYINLTSKKSLYSMMSPIQVSILVAHYPSHTQHCCKIRIQSKKCRILRTLLKSRSFQVQTVIYYSSGEYDRT